MLSRNSIRKMPIDAKLIGRIEAAQGLVIDVRCDYLPPLGQALDVANGEGRHPTNSRHSNIFRIADIMGSIGYRICTQTN